MSKKMKNVTPLGGLNPYAPEISDEHYINEIIGIDEIRYKDFVKEPEPRLHRTKAQEGFFEFWGAKK
tara:strand:- start:297 stop:497 length:201 start_codon:yes stop_codon:yes gene_type:complete